MEWVLLTVFLSTTNPDLPEIVGRYSTKADCLAANKMADDAAKMKEVGPPRQHIADEGHWAFVCRSLPKEVWR